jgi:carboxyl-terminal processing protease
VRDRHKPKALRARSQSEVHEAIIAMIAELETSHGELIEADVYTRFYDAEAKARLEPQFGMIITRLEEGFFVSEVLAGSGAAAARILRGDRLLAVNGQPPDPADMLPVPYDAGLGGPRSYRLPVRQAGDTVRIEIERFQRPKYGRMSAMVTATRWNAVEASRASRRVITLWGIKFGYMRLHHVLSEDIVLFLEEFLAQLDDAEGFVLDLRGAGGLPPLIDRTLTCFDKNTLGKPLWDRPVVALIDKSSRSAKEALAHVWRQRRVGPLVGTTTAGAVLGATFSKLKDGAWLMVPVMDMRSMTGGVVLEGRGVTPDFQVSDDLPWCEGADPILRKGVLVLADIAIVARRRGKRHGWH